MLAISVDISGDIWENLSASSVASVASSVRPAEAVALKHNPAEAVGLKHDPAEAVALKHDPAEAVTLNRDDAQTRKAAFCVMKVRSSEVIT